MIGGIIVFLAIFTVFVFVLAAVIGLIIRAGRSEDKETVLEFKNKIRSLYIYTVLSVLLFTLIGGTIWLINSTTNMMIPDVTRTRETREERLDSEFDDWGMRTSSSSWERNERTRRRNRDIKGIYVSSSIIIVTLPIMLYHSKLAKKERENKV